MTGQAHSYRAANTQLQLHGSCLPAVCPLTGIKGLSFPLIRWEFLTWTSEHQRFRNSDPKARSQQIPMHPASPWSFSCSSSRRTLGDHKGFTFSFISDPCPKQTRWGQKGLVHFTDEETETPRGLWCAQRQSYHESNTTDVPEFHRVSAMSSHSQMVLVVW